MAYEFKKLSDVDKIEKVSDNANVLIEEDGVIKKAPKSQVGGGGDSTYYVIIDEDGKVTAPEGFYDILVEKFTNFNGISVRVFWKRSGYISEYTPENYDGFDGEQISINCNYGMSVYIEKDGQHRYYWD